MSNLKEAPFYLTEEDIRWVEETLAGMSLEEKIGQMFCLTGMMTEPEELEPLLEKYYPGAFMYRSAPAKKVQQAQRFMQEKSRIPMLFAANLESGGNGVAEEGTFYAKQMQVAATDDERMAYRLGKICNREAGACGSNWAFAPIVDIDMNWRNPITNVRTYGNDAERVLRMAQAYLAGMKDGGYPMAACIKHFPGDGVDERDQHLLPTVNSLSEAEWEATFGKVYRTLINEGAMTVMVGHIMQPELTRKYAPELTDEEILPASTNSYLVTNLLRGELGFNGLITTDATAMVGYSSLDKRSECLPKSIAAGCDMVLFCKNIEEDYASMRRGLDRGILTIERIDEAVERILAAKAALGLHRGERSALVPDVDVMEVLGCDEHVTWAKECADKAITLVKDTQNLLPVTPERYKKVRMTVLGEKASGGFGDNAKVTEPLVAALEAAGFEVVLFNYETLECGEIFESGIADIKEKFDLSIVVANVANASNHTTRRLDWVTLMAADEPWYVKDIPTMFVSFANPYHLVDVPFISTFVNCYSSSGYCVEAFVDKLTGKSEFKGKSPVNPFCGIWGADCY